MNYVYNTDTEATFKKYDQLLRQGPIEEYMHYLGEIMKPNWFKLIQKQYLRMKELDPNNTNPTNFIQFLDHCLWNLKFVSLEFMGKMFDRIYRETKETLENPIDREKHQKHKKPMPHL